MQDIKDVMSPYRGPTTYCSLTVVPTLSLTEFQTFTAIRSFILTLVNSSVEVIRGQVNRVGEPHVNDFIVIWPIIQKRLSTNIDTFFDNQAVGTITGDVMVITQILCGSVPLNMPIIDINNTFHDLVATKQLIIAPGQAPGGIGTYQLNQELSPVPEEVFYIGVREDLAPTQFGVQVEIHGPSSASTAKILEGLFRSEVATDYFSTTGYDVTPLYCDEARYIPFVNAEQQFEYRWILDLQVQTNPIIGTNQQFADRLEGHTIPVDIVFRADGGSSVNVDGLGTFTGVPTGMFTGNGTFQFTSNGLVIADNNGNQIIMSPSGIQIISNQLTSSGDIIAGEGGPVTVSFIDHTHGGVLTGSGHTSTPDP